MPAEALAVAIRRLALHQPLDGEELHQAFKVIMRGEGTRPRWPRC